MPKYCYVPRCQSTEDRKYFSVPFTKPERWKKWLEACPFLRRYKVAQLGNVRICQWHFNPEHITPGQKLTPDAVPVLNVNRDTTQHYFEIDTSCAAGPFHLNVYPPSVIKKEGTEIRTDKTYIDVDDFVDSHSISNQSVSNITNGVERSRNCPDNQRHVSKITSNEIAFENAQELLANYEEEVMATFTVASELCVAIMTEPFKRMVQSQVDKICQHIDTKICDEIISRSQTSLTSQGKNIMFRGRAHFADGVLKMWCEDAHTRAWLVRTVEGAQMESPIADTKLVVRPQADIPYTGPCMIFLPRHTGNTRLLRELLSAQNPNLSMNSWELMYEKSTPNGTYVFFHVPEDSRKILNAQNRRIYYLTGTICARFIGKD